MGLAAMTPGNNYVNSIDGGSAGPINGFDGHTIGTINSGHGDTNSTVKGVHGGTNGTTNGVDGGTNGIVNGINGGERDLVEGFHHSAQDSTMFATDLDGVDQPRLEPIAVIGFFLKFPQDATSSEAFWKMLMEKRCSMTEWPKERLNLNAFYHPDSSRPDTVLSSLMP